MTHPCDHCGEDTDEGELKHVRDLFLCEECFQLARTVLIEAGEADPEGPEVAKQ